jgi:type III restriction enzyme
LKLKFIQQDFQTDAVDAVCALFDGQQRRIGGDGLEPEYFTGIGAANVLHIDDEKIIENMHSVQRKNHLPLTDGLQGRQFSIEMETGTGKTYVYTKTIYELNCRYGFTKFIIVVPGVAVREGVCKSLQITQEHFALLYDHVPCRYFIYNSGKLWDVRRFAASANIEIMIINIDAFRKAENVINRENDKLNGDTALSYIRAANPIVIIDEPQSVDNTPKAREAVASLHPMCIFRYSATHREKVNLLYRLTPVDACQMGLVKQICVSTVRAEAGFNKPYIRLLSVSDKNGFRARIEMDIADKNGRVSRRAVTVRQDADLYRLSGDRSLYQNCKVSGIDCTPGKEQIEISGADRVLLGKAMGDIDRNRIRRAQIRRTIEVHFEKELLYTKKGIKVLSLFFIDEVRKYRGEEGSAGIYARMFEEAYKELIALPRYAVLRHFFPSDVSAVHGGYFSQDKKGRCKNTRGDSRDDSDTYHTIMKDKEWLLSFACPLRFIFSHSALKEGWDNPNVFQVCTLMEQKSALTARQKVGRGLRLCVDQNGERIEDRNVNLLHIIADESFAEFAHRLQTEIAEETGVKFGILQSDQGVVQTDFKEEAAVSFPRPERAVLVPVGEEELIERCAEALRGMPPVPKERIVTQTAEIRIEQPGVSYIEREGQAVPLSENLPPLPDLLRIIGARTLLKRTAVFEILRRSGRLEDFLNNPQRFLENAAEIILGVRGFFTRK